jgi:hypothetical protein
METATDLMRYLWRGGAWGFVWVKPPKVSYWLATSEVPAHFKTIERDVYFGIHPTTAIPTHNAAGKPKPPEAVRSQIPYVAAINCLFAEVDGQQCGSKAAALARVRLMIPAPSVVIDSGGGYHCYWLLDRPLVLTDAETREYARRLQARWVEHVGGDKGAKDLARVLRVPGTYNCKAEYGLPHPLVHFERVLNVTYSLHQLTGGLPADKPRPARPETAPATAAILDRQAALVAQASAGARNATLNRAAFILHFAIENGIVDRMTAENVLLQAALAAGLPEGEALRTISSGFNARGMQ